MCLVEAQHVMQHGGTDVMLAALTINNLGVPHQLKTDCTLTPQHPRPCPHIPPSRQPLSRQ